MKLTEREKAASLGLDDIIHVVLVNDSSQDPSGSSYKADINQIIGLVPSYWISGSSGNYSIKVVNDSGLEASGDYSVAEGYNTTASGEASHAEGYETIASGDYSHAEGGNTIATNNYSHAEGSQTIASGQAAHAEGWGSIASGDYSHAGGAYSQANGDNSFVHGDYSQANGLNTNVLGAYITGNQDNTTYVDGFNVRTLGSGTSVKPLGIDSSGNIVSGATDLTVTAMTFNQSTYDLTIIKNNGSTYTSNLGILASDMKVTGGTYNPANGVATFVNNSGGTFNVSGFITGFTDTYTTSGVYNQTNGVATFTNNLGGSFNVSGFNTGTTNTDTYVTGGTYNSSNGVATFTNNLGNDFTLNGFSTGETASLTYWSADTGTNAIVTINSGNIANGYTSIAMGGNTTASGNYSHAEGYDSIASGTTSHAEGYGTQANGYASHSEGQNTTANGSESHAEGFGTLANGVDSHAQGYVTTASGSHSHAEGGSTVASGNYSHAGGQNTIVGGDASFGHGYGHSVSGDYATAFGDTNNVTAYGASAMGMFINNNSLFGFSTGINLNSSGYMTTLMGVGHVVTGLTTTVVGQAANLINNSVADHNAFPLKEMFVVGNGTIQNNDADYNVTSRSDAFIVRYNGVATLPSVTNTLINTEPTGKALITREYLTANSLSGNSLTAGYLPKATGNGGLIDSVLVQFGGYIGLGSATVPGELFHIGDGNILLEGGGEVAQKFKRDFTTTGENGGVQTGSGISVNPIFQIGRIIQAGDGDPEIRVMYSDDSASERTVFEIDRKGIAASVKTSIGSHFEGFKSLTDVNPMFRLNSYPRMRLEMGEGGNNLTDVAVERNSLGGLSFFTNNTEKATLNSIGLITLPSITNELIDAESTGKVLVTREYLQANSGVTSTNLQKVITTNYTLTSADNNYTILIDNDTTPINVTIPSGLLLNINIGFIQQGTGDVTFITSGTTIKTPIVGAYKIKGQNYNAYLEQVGSSNVFHLLGNIKI